MQLLRILLLWLFDLWVLHVAVSVLAVNAVSAGNFAANAVAVD